MANFLNFRHCLKLSLLHSPKLNYGQLAQSWFPKHLEPVRTRWRQYRELIIYTLEYHSAIKKTKRGNPAFATAWMDFEGIMLSARNQSMTNTIRSHLVNLEKPTSPTNTTKLIENLIWFVITRGWGWGRDWRKVVKRYRFPVMWQKKVPGL